VGWADKVRSLGVRANADTPADARVAVRFGAQGIGLCRTSTCSRRGAHPAVREMILSDTAEAAEEGAGQDSADAAQRFRRAVRDHAGLPVTSGCSIRRCMSSCRTPKRTSRVAAAMGRRSEKLSNRAKELAEFKSDAGLSRLPHRHRLS